MPIQLFGGEKSITHSSLKHSLRRSEMETNILSDTEKYYKQSIIITQVEESLSCFNLFEHTTKVLLICCIKTDGKPTST